jgi:hypothetical protein
LHFVSEYWSYLQSNQQAFLLHIIMNEQWGEGRLFWTVVLDGKSKFMLSRGWACIQEATLYLFLKNYDIFL